LRLWATHLGRERQARVNGVRCERDDHLMALTALGSHARELRDGRLRYETVTGYKFEPAGETPIGRQI
jgi:hypothetical protein